MKPLFLLLITMPLFVTAQQADVLIRNGKVLDGTGNSWYYADVAVKDGKIMAIGKLTNYSAAKTLDAKGLIVAPGFIDVHTHCEGDEKKNPLAQNFLLDGVTTVITGNCGSSNTNLAAYFSLLDSIKMSINIASLIGHNDVRKAVMGTAMRDPNEIELQQMEAIVNQAMKDGAVGLSTGLIYIPGTYSKTEEVVRLAKVASGYGGVYASHMRDEADSVVEAINEAIYIGRVANIPVEISHFKLSGQQNWGRSKQTIALIEAARKEGIDVTIDQYPYTASSTNLGTLMPDWIMADGQDSIVARLSNPAIQKQVASIMLKKLAKRKQSHFSYPVVAFFKADTTPAHTAPSPGKLPARPITRDLKPNPEARSFPIISACETMSLISTASSRSATTGRCITSALVALIAEQRFGCSSMRRRFVSLPQPVNYLKSSLLIPRRTTNLNEKPCW